MLYLKGLMHKISFKKQIVILCIFILFSMLESILDNSSFNSIATSILPKLLIGLAIIYLQSEKKSLGAHLVLLFAMFSDYIYRFISQALSFHFGTLNFLRTIDYFDAIGFVLSVYLIIFIISLLLNEKQIDFKVTFYPMTVLLSVYLYVRFGFEYALIAFMLMMLFVLLKSKIPMYLFMLSYVINIPFFMIDLIIDRVGFHLLSYWIYGLFGLVLLVFVATRLIKALNEVEA